ncbi:MAG: metabolite traffic protein EboE [Burkholderiales bacterium]
MHLSRLKAQPHLTYCTNIHAGESWEEVRDSLNTFVPPIRDALTQGAPMGIGLRLSGQAAFSLQDSHTLKAFQQQLLGLNAYVFSLNAFPYGQFHGTQVKQDVYLPDWASPERLRYTLACIDILVALLPEGVDGSISTVPVGFRDAAQAPGALDNILDHLLQCVVHLVDCAQRQGKLIALALEPEPACYLETTQEAADFILDHMRSPAVVSKLAQTLSCSNEQAMAALRTHLGVCFDVCHSAVAFEDPLQAMRQLRAVGICIPKIQLSSAVRIPDMRADLLPALHMFDDAVYLHQVVVQSQDLTRFLDLPQAMAAYQAGQANGEWRVHCHVPVFLEHAGAISTTQAQLLQTLQGCKLEGFSSHLEVETYTWDVLPAALKTDSKAQAIARELQFVHQILTT